MALYTLQPTSIGVASSGLTTSITTYTSGDMLGAEATVTGAAATTGGRGVITSITVQDSGKVVGAVDIRLFTAASTPAANNAANAWADADSRLQVVGIQVAAPVVSANNAVSYTGNLWLPFTTTSSANLFLNVITLTANAVFVGATDLQYTFEILQWV